MAPGVSAACVIVAVFLLVGGCAEVSQVRLDVAPDARYGAFLEGSGHINPEDPGLPNGGN